MKQDSTELISVKGLNKHFKVLQKKPGFWGSIRALVSHDYRVVDAVKDINLEIRRGEMVGYVGPNGAGKSTTIKMLTGILYPSSGKIRVGSLDPFKDRKKFTRTIGVMFGQKTQLWWDLPLVESFDLLRYIYKIDTERYTKNINYFDSILGIKEYWQQPVRRLSLGQRVKGDLVAALLHDPEVLFLDEPTIGLDILARENFREMVLEINRKKNTTVMITSHDLADIERIAQRLVLIDKGTILYDGAIQQFLKKYGSKGKLVVYYRSKPREKKISENLYTASRNPVKGIDSITVDLNRIEIEFYREKMPYKKLLAMVSDIGDIEDIQIGSGELEAILTGLYKSP